jgi:hypothetical protein
MRVYGSTANTVRIRDSMSREKACHYTKILQRSPQNPSFPLRKFELSW